MEKTTKFLKDAKEKMKNKQYKDAIEDLDVAIMLNCINFFLKKIINYLLQSNVSRLT